MTKIFKDSVKTDIEEAGKILRDGGLVAIPTETVYGLAANALNPTAVKNIYKVKGRPSDNPLIVHISEVEEMKPLVKEITEAAKKLADAFWPGALTIILPKTDVIPAQTSGGLDTVAVRLPSNPVARAVIKAAGCPLAAPSANLSGKPSPTDFKHVYEDLFGKVEGIIDGGSCDVGVESTVITLATEFPKVLRPGGITVEQLRAVLGRVDVDDAVVHRLKNEEKAASPGMKYKHYSPSCDITIADMPLVDYVELVNNSPSDVCAMCFEGEEKLINKPAVTFGKEFDGESQARRLFNALYELDEKGIKKAYARCPQKVGVGLAVYNRLIRSAGFKVIKPETTVVGLTGQSGAGKSTVSRAFEAKGVSVIDCDKITRSTSVYNSDCINELKNSFGNDIINSAGELNRQELARRAFSSEVGKNKLNEITLPRIMTVVKAEIDRNKSLGQKIIILDAPTLFEAGGNSLCSRIVAVTAPSHVRAKRIMERDGISANDAEIRMNAQLSEEFFVSHSDYLIVSTDSTDVNVEAQKILDSLILE